MHDEEIRESGGVRWLEFVSLQHPGLLHGFSLRQGGVSHAPYDTLNLGFHVADKPENVLENRRRLAASLCYQPEDVVSGEQIHKTRVVVVSSKMRGLGHGTHDDALPGTDGLICTEPGIVLMAHSADCTILFFYDPKKRCTGLAHAGWRGAVAGMGPVMVQAMTELGCLRENIHVAISPTVGPCCYRVGENVAGQVAVHLRTQVISAREGVLFMDLPGLQRLQLLDVGISATKIAQSGYCTNCRDELFFSHRASGGITGRMAGVISLINYREY